MVGHADCRAIDGRQGVNPSQKRLLRVACVSACILVTSSGCGQIRQQVDVPFGDQNFKSAIALIELHKVRAGSYPASLEDLKFLGAWDRNWLSAVEYRKLEDGYELNLTRGWVGTPDLKYPAEFWRGLGLRKTNVRRDGA